MTVVIAVIQAMEWRMLPGSFERAQRSSSHAIQIDTIPVAKAPTAKMLWLAFDRSGFRQRFSGCGNRAQVPDRIVGANIKIDAIPKIFERVNISIGKFLLITPTTVTMIPRMSSSALPEVPFNERASDSQTTSEREKNRVQPVFMVTLPD